MYVVSYCKRPVWGRTTGWGDSLTQKKPAVVIPSHKTWSTRQGVGPKRPFRLDFTLLISGGIEQNTTESSSQGRWLLNYVLAFHVWVTAIGGFVLMYGNVCQRVHWLWECAVGGLIRIWKTPFAKMTPDSDFPLHNRVHSPPKKWVMKKKKGQ